MNNSRITTELNNPVWLTLNETCLLLNLAAKTVKDKCRNGQFTYKITRYKTKVHYYVKLDSLPEKYINKYLNGINNSYLHYGDVPEWTKKQAHKYIAIIEESGNLKGGALKEYISNWNIQNPQFKTTYSSVMRMKQRYQMYGIDGLLSKKGHNRQTSVPDTYFEYFKNLYFKEGAPSLRTCWDLTLGWAIRTSGIEKASFPSHMSFRRRLENDIPKQSIYLARKGQTAWNRKYGNYIDRDYSNILCGKVWVSDHAQIDVACMTQDGNVVFPWVTAWRDYKSGKWLGWILQTGHPDSDLIFQSFYYSAEVFGLPEDVIIDNGKDYRCKDFAGGRKSIQIETDKPKTRSMLAELNIKVHFALPYNAQTKPIERDFLKIKELLSKHCKGYRGGNVVERPEKLAEEIKQNKLIQFEDFKKIFDDFIINVLNKRPSEGKNLKGLCPDELFNGEFNEKITTSKDALKLFCMRTSKTFTVGRNGIRDNEFGIFYWADWMIAKTGLKVYLRRDTKNYKEAWAFKAENDEFVGKVSAVKAVAALNADTVSKDEFKNAMSIKKRNLKIAKSYIKQTREISAEEKYENYKSAYAKVIKESKPKVSKIANTNMDKAIRKNEETESIKQFDYTEFIEKQNSTKIKPLYLFETDKILAEEAEFREMKGAANGY